MTNRIMTDIKPISYWKQLYMGCYLLVIISIALLMSLTWWAVIFIIAISIITFIVSEQWHVQPIHLTQADPENRMTRWQLVYEGYEKNELWEATLLDIRSYRHCVQLVFDTTHPIVTRGIVTREYVVIWQDQVDIESWRQLKVLARWA